jgi:ligand-binding SRPBCC domain-containing protein
MPTYERETRVRAPLEDLWEFHSTVEGLVALTPDWMRMRVEALHGPDGDSLDREAVLAAGARVTLSVRPFGVGPRQSWTSLIRTREREEGAAVFRDEMVDGPFSRWVHTHAFYADDGETLLRDTVEYELPLGALGRAVGPLAVVGFEPMFRDRHRRTRRLLAP